jgi:hypothetical protein
MLTVKQRAAISGGVALGILLVLSLWPLPEYGPYRPSTFIVVVAATWFGPALLLTFPLLVVWMSFAAQTREGASAGIGLSMLLLVLCLAFVWFAREAYYSYFGYVGLH